MNMRMILILLVLAGLGCNDQVETVTYGNESDTTANSLERSRIINDSSQLPLDSTSTGVQH